MAFPGMKNPVANVGNMLFRKNGTLVYIPSLGLNEELHILTLVNRQGITQPVSETTGVYSLPRFSPDGGRLIVTVRDGPAFHLWSYELALDFLL